MEVELWQKERIFERRGEGPFYNYNGYRLLVSGCGAKSMWGHSTIYSSYLCSYVQNAKINRKLLPSLCPLSDDQKN